MKLTQIKAQLDALTPSQRANIRQYLAMREALGAVERYEKEQFDAAQLMLEAIADITRRNGNDMTPPHRLRKTPNYKEFKQKHDEGLSEFLRDAVKRNRVKLRALVWLSVKLLYRHLVEMGVPVSARMMMNHIHRIPSVLDDAFPGYARSGLLGIVIKEEDRRVRNKRDSG